MNWTPITTLPPRYGYYAVHFSWSPVPDVVHFGSNGWRKHGRLLHGIEAWLSIPAYERPKDPFL